MYVTPDNADMSELRWHEAPGAPARTMALPQVSTLRATQLRFGRSVVSRHNTSAPDIAFRSFRRGPLKPY